MGDLNHLKVCGTAASRIREKDGFGGKIVFPVLVTYKGRTLPVATPEDPTAHWARIHGEQVDEAILYGVRSEQYVRQLTRTDRPKVAFLEGHGELAPIQVQDITGLLNEQYDVSRVRIDGQLNSLSDRPRARGSG